ncbi:MAG: signal peptidase I [Terriglobia bacterium]
MSPEGTRKHSTVREYIDSLLVTVILALFGVTFVLQAFKIPSSSMENTLLVGDHLLVNKFCFADGPEASWGLLPYREVERGDIIVFKYPFPPYQHFVKRVIAVPGDRLKIVERQVYINGELLEEPYKIHRDEFATRRFQDNFPPAAYAYSYSLGNDWGRELAERTEGDELVIPPGKYFAMGDNRDNSQDSRFWGFVDRRNISGWPLIIYWSFGGPAGRSRRSGPASPPATAAWDNLSRFFARARWKRVLRLVR